MSRRRTAHTTQGAEQTANDLLARRIPVDARELLETIHAINPTGRSLSAADERRRYELKARLQSLLVRAFPDDLVVTAEDHGVVAIRHRYLGLDACHTRLDELDDDARARVRWLLDVGDAGEPGGGDARGAGASDGAGGDPAGPLARARAALAEYDYEAARAQFEQAALGGGSPVAARELLELLVDQLALDAEALALEERLPERVAAAADVRALLAMAAARTGDDAAATRLLDGLVGPRAADAWAALAEGALRRQAFDELDRFVARLAGADPAHPDIVRLRADAGRQRADARRPAEQELARLAETADDAAIEAAARALLARWPDSAVAGKLLGRLHERQRAAEIERLAAGARQALDAGNLARATELCRQARGHGADTAALVAQIHDAEAAQRRARDDAEVAAVCARLAEPDPRPGLAAFAALEPELRARVRGRVVGPAEPERGAPAGRQAGAPTVSRGQAELPALEWIEQVLARSKGARPVAVVEAALAGPAAAAAFARGDDEGALALLEAQPLLAGVPRASELRAEAQARLTGRRRDAASQALGDAQRALAAGDLEACERACDRIGRDLDAALRPQLDEVRRAVRERRERARRRGQVDELARAGDLVSAVRELAALLASALPGDDAAALRARHGELRAELARAWCVRRDPAPPAHGDPLGELLGEVPYAEACALLLTDGAGELVVATAAGTHVFLGRARVADGRLIERRYLRAPEPMDKLVMTIVDGSTLWLADTKGRVLQVSWRTGEPVRWGSLAPFTSSGEQVVRIFRVPGGSHLWMEAELPGGSDLAAHVIEVESWRPRRDIPSARHLQPVIAGEASCVLGMPYDGGAMRYTERGALIEEISATAHLQVTGATVAPDRELVVFGGRPYDYGDEELSELQILRLRGGRAIHRELVPELDHEMAHHCAGARGPGLLVLHHVVNRGAARLVVYPFTESGLGPARAVAAPSGLLLIQDRDASQVAGMWDGAERIEIALMSDEPPSFEGAVMYRSQWLLPELEGVFSCAPHGHGPTTPHLDAADKPVHRRDWREVRSLLEDVPLEGMAPEAIPHHCHLLGLAWLHTGVEPARVRELWQRGSAAEQDSDRIFTCRLASCLDLVEPLPDPLPPSWWSPDATALRQLRGAVATADRLLAERQPRAALEVMRRRAVTRVHDLQSTARLAAAWLELDATHTAEQFDKAIALSRFVALATTPRLNLPIEGAWSAEQIAALAARATAWLATWHDQVAPA